MEILHFVWKFFFNKLCIWLFFHDTQYSLRHDIYIVPNFCYYKQTIMNSLAYKNLFTSLFISLLKLPRDRITVIKTKYFSDSCYILPICSSGKLYASSSKRLAISHSLTQTRHHEFLNLYRSDRWKVVYHYWFNY